MDVLDGLISNSSRAPKTGSHTADAAVRSSTVVWAWYALLKATTEVSTARQPRKPCSYWD